MIEDILPNLCPKCKDVVFKWLRENAKEDI